MIEQILNIDLNNLLQHHYDVMEKLVKYNNELELKLQLYKEYEEIGGIEKEDFILNEQDTLFTVLGSITTIIYFYNKIEEYEWSAELHHELKKSFCLMYDEIFPDVDNEEKFRQLLSSTFDTFKTIFENDK
jgi:hypothetical protein